MHITESILRVGMKMNDGSKREKMQIPRPKRSPYQRHKEDLSHLHILPQEPSVASVIVSSDTKLVWHGTHISADDENDDDDDNLSRGSADTQAAYMTA